MNLLISLFLLGVIGYLIYIVWRKNKRISKLEQIEEKIPEIVKKEKKESLKRSKAVLSGQAAEQIAPYLKDFPYYPGDCRFLGSPIDLVVFVGNTAKNVEKVVFIEIKTGSSGLSKRQRQIRNAIEQGNVEWLEYRIDIS